MFSPATVAARADASPRRRKGKAVGGKVAGGAPQVDDTVIPEARSLAAPWWQRMFVLDLWSLAVFRVGLALVILADTLVAISNAEAFYSDAGVLPRTAMYELSWADQGFWSLHALGGSVAYQVTLMCVQLVSALCLLAGHRTRLATFVCWLLLASLDSRNLLINNGADSMIRMLAFWSIFLPLGARWSLDARASAGRGPGSWADRDATWISFAGACLILQVVFVYWFSVAFKSHEVWWSQGTALRQVLALDVYARPLALWVREHPDLCRWLTHGTLALEILGPLLALLPFWSARFRMVAVAAMISLHAGIALCLDIGAFPWIMMAAWCAFLPREFWIWLGKKEGQSGEAGMQESSVDVSAPLPRRSPLALRRVVNGFLAICLGLVFMWNLRGTNFAYWEQYFPRSVNPLVLKLRLDQYWTMFAPTPLREDGWFILRAGLSDGSEVDLLRDGAPVDWRKRENLHTHFKDSRWLKYLMNLWLKANHTHRPLYGDFIARTWNETHGGLSQVVAWQLWFVMEETQPDGTDGTRLQPVLMHEREKFP